MLSPRRCREILGADCTLEDSQLELLRDQLTALADIALAFGSRKSRHGFSSVFDAALKLIPEEEQEQVVERAAIMEFDGRLQRAKAEESALRSLKSTSHEGSGKRLN